MAHQCNRRRPATFARRPRGSDRAAKPALAFDPVALVARRSRTGREKEATRNTISQRCNDASAPFCPVIPGPNRQVLLSFRHPLWRRLYATIDHVDNPPHNFNLVMVITAATRRNGESPRHQKRENERHVESAELSGLRQSSVRRGQRRFATWNVESGTQSSPGPIECWLRRKAK